MGAQCYTSKSISDTLNPKWNFNCQFFIKDLYQDVLCITVFEKDQFSPDGESADTTKRCSHKQKGLLAFCPVRIKGLNGCVPGSDSGFHLHYCYVDAAIPFLSVFQPFATTVIVLAASRQALPDRFFVILFKLQF